ncbi:MAG: methyltransferase [Clostridia bacterium]|nr:methyltransferase [Clostridia bacterium]
MDIKLLQGERLDAVNDKLSLIQRTGGLTFGTDALLLAAYISRHKGVGLELGSGTGIISLLLLSREKLTRITCAEVQEAYASLTKRNAELNRLCDRLEVICADVRELPHSEDYDAVFTNPPYMKTTSGRANSEDEKNAARHEVFGDIGDFLACAKRKLKFGGAFYAVYRPDRLTDLILAMRENKIEPKRLTMVFASADCEPSMVLVEGRRGGGVGLYTTPPLILYKDREHREYSDGMRYILENGSFPDVYFKRGLKNARQ